LFQQHESNHRRRLIVNALSLYAVQGCTYLLPLITFPYIARVLGPEHFGHVAFAQSIGAFIVLAVDYGFNFSATRQVARMVGNKRELRELVAGVLGAKLLIALGCTLAVLLARPILVRFAGSPLLLWCSLLWGIGQGINMLWYFQGLQRMTWAAGLDVAGKIVSTAGVFFFVHSGEDGWKILCCQAVGCGVSHLITVITAYREVGFCLPRWRLVSRALSVGWSLFIYRASESLLTLVDTPILGTFSSPYNLGLFLGADRIRQIAVQGFWPITQTLFPYQSSQVVQEPKRGARIVRRSMLLIGSASGLLALIAAALAPYILQLSIGSAFLPATTTLRVLCLLIPFQAMNLVLAFQWVLPLGLDREFNGVVIATGVFNVLIAIALVKPFSALGMAIAIAAAQIFQLCALELVLRRKHRSVFASLELPEATVAHSLPRAA
jgi:polysaccharide transporter, PST family